MYFYQSLTKYKPLFAIYMLLIVTACADPNNATGSELDISQNNNLPILEVFKRASCGCCVKWIDHLKNQGFEANSQNLQNLATWKKEKGIQTKYHSCHTAVSADGYVFEGHIPAKYIHQFLAESPKNAIGLAVPGMPVGTPGMEVGDRFSPYRILLLKADGSHEIYATINRYEDQFDDKIN